MKSYYSPKITGRKRFKKHITPRKKELPLIKTNKKLVGMKIENKARIYNRISYKKPKGKEDSQEDKQKRKMINIKL